MRNYDNCEVQSKKEQHFVLHQREVLLVALAVEHCFVDDYGNSGLMIEMQCNSVT